MPKRQTLPAPGWPLASLDDAIDQGRQAAAVGGEALQILLDGCKAVRALNERAARGLDPLSYWLDLAGIVAETQSELTACGLRLVDTDEWFAAARLLHAPTAPQGIDVQGSPRPAHHLAACHAATARPPAVSHEEQ